MLEKFKSLFFEKMEDTSTDDASSDVTKETVKGGSEKIKSSSNVSRSSGSVDNKLLKVLSSAVQEANIDGFDYIEYKESIKSLEKMDMSEATRYQSALAMAKTMGANPDRLIQSAEYYLGILDEERKKFGGVIESQRQAKIGDKMDGIAKMEQIVQQKLEEIEKIKLEINKITAEIEKEKSSIAGAQQKIEGTLMNFEASFQTIYQAISEDIKKMKTYLK